MGENRSRREARVAACPHRPSDSDESYRFYGRRSGRKLRPARRKLLADLLPRLKIDLGAAADPEWTAGRGYDATWLEIGFGGGEHLAWQAVHNPEVLMLGAEPYVNGVASLLAHIDAQAIANIRIWPDDARFLIDALADASVERIFILHPDPWPKTRHAQRRIVGAATLPKLARVLAAGGLLRIASDEPAYIDWTLSAMAGRREFAWRAEGPEDWRRPPLDWPPTRYGQKAERRGRPPIYLEFERRT